MWKNIIKSNIQDLPQCIFQFGLYLIVYSALKVGLIVLPTQFKKKKYIFLLKTVQRKSVFFEEKIK